MNMATLPVLAKVGFFMQVMAAIWCIAALAVVLIILVQKGKGGGLSSAFGGGLASGLLGSKTGDFLTWLTISVVGLFLLISVLMAKFYRPTVSSFGDETPVNAATEMPQQQPAVAESTEDIPVAQQGEGMVDFKQTPAGPIGTQEVNLPK